MTQGDRLHNAFCAEQITDMLDDAPVAVFISEADGGRASVCKQAGKRSFPEKTGREDDCFCYNVARL